MITRSNILCQVLATSNVACNNKKHPGNAPTSSILLLGVRQVVFHFKYSCPLLPLAAAMAFYMPTLSCSPSSMPAPTWSLWCPDAPLMRPMTGTMPQQKPRLTLPPISQLDRHLPPCMCVFSSPHTFCSHNASNSINRGIISHTPPINFSCR